MRGRMTKLVAALGLLAMLAVVGVAQDVGEIVPEVPVTGTSGHTIQELGQGVRQEARRVGAKLDAAGREIKDEIGHVRREVAQTFEAVQSDVQKMPTHHRVYSRIHWDKLLHHAKIEVHMLRGGAVLLRGTVPTEAARSRAVELARDCVGVTTIVDELSLTPQVTHNPSARARR